MLLTPWGQAKLCDFGTAKDLRNAAASGPDFAGTPEYMAPEAVRGRDVGTAADLWSFACLLYQLHAGRPPFAAGSPYLAMQAAESGGIAFPAEFPPVARSLCCALLRRDPGARLGAGEASQGYPSIRAHPYFAGTPWHALAPAAAPEPCVPRVSLAAARAAPDSRAPATDQFVSVEEAVRRAGAAEESEEAPAEWEAAVAAQAGTEVCHDLWPPLPARPLTDAAASTLAHTLRRLVMARACAGEEEDEEEGEGFDDGHRATRCAVGGTRPPHPHQHPWPSLCVRAAAAWREPAMSGVRHRFRRWGTDHVPLWRALCGVGRRSRVRFGVWGRDAGVDGLHHARGRLWQRPLWLAVVGGPCARPGDRDHRAALVACVQRLASASPPPRAIVITGPWLHPREAARMTPAQRNAAICDLYAAADAVLPEHVELVRCLPAPTCPLGWGTHPMGWATVRRSQARVWGTRRWIRWRAFAERATPWVHPTAARGPLPAPRSPPSAQC